MGHDNMSGMDMGSSSPSDGHSSMMMNTVFSASTPMMPLWFSGWQPSNAGATFGACVGLCGLAVLSRLLGAVRHQASLGWSLGRWHGTHLALEKNDQTEQDDQQGTARPLRPIPWIASHEIPRGILAALHTGLEYFLMLAVMTFNAYYFVAIVLGVFIGEVAFGRWSSVDRSHGSHG